MNDRRYCQKAKKTCPTTKKTNVPKRETWWQYQSQGVCRQKITVGVHKQSRYKLTNHVTRSNATEMCTDAKEGQYTIVMDIRGAFLHADMEQDVHMLLEGTISKLIVKLEPRLYRKFVWRNKHGKSMLCVKLRKALYCTLQAALRYWRLLSDKLIYCGLKLNGYDRCITNKIINSKQCKIIWHVDDLKISHVEKKNHGKYYWQIQQEIQGL